MDHEPSTADLLAATQSLTTQAALLSRSIDATVEELYEFAAEVKRERDRRMKPKQSYRGVERRRAT